MQVSLFSPAVYNNNVRGSNKNSCLSSHKSDSVEFSGLYNKEDPALFVFDLDGTFANGTDKEINDVVKLQKSRNAVLAYATGRRLYEFTNLQNELKEKGVHLPTPQYLIANDGQYIYKNVDGKLVEDKDWNHQLLQKTHYDRDTIYDTIKHIANTPEYSLNKNDRNTLKKMNDYKQRRHIDKDFWHSKIGYYEGNHSDRKLEYVLAPDVDPHKLKRRVRQELKEKGIKAKFIINTYEKSGLDYVEDDIHTKTKPFRVRSDGAIPTIFICAANKSDGINYIKNKLDVPFQDVVLAGNDGNDINMSKMVKRGAFFVCVGNATDNLKDFLFNNLYYNPNVIHAKKPGAGGILEGINKILSNVNCE